MSSNVKDKDRCCSDDSVPDCCASTDTAKNPPAKKEQVNIDFMYLDLDICTRCRGAESSLESAIAEVSRVLEATGVQVKVQHIHVKSEQQAAELGFVVSPTIRVNNRDIQIGFRESQCESCGTLCDCEGGISCREWEYQGQWYSVPPKGLIIDSILKAVYGGAVDEQRVADQSERVPDNLKRFFAGAHKK
ncbi:MAG: DUF2703 domain-containing protein [Psychromonas sp.]